MTPRQESFIDHYALCGNAAEAARLAGYSANTSRQIGSRLLSNVDVKAALQARQKVFQVELGVTKDDVISCILKAIEMGREQQSPAVMIQGCVQLAKMLGFYEHEQFSLQLSAGGEHLIAKYAAMTDEELIAIVERS